MTRFLVTTDFSPESRRAIAPTIELTRKVGGQITLLTVIIEVSTMPPDSLFVSPIPTPNESELVDRARKSLEQLRAEVAEGVEVEIDTDVVLGKTVETQVSEYAKHHDVDYLAVSTHGRSGLRRLLIGSVAEGILRHSCVPVLVFPPQAE